MIVSRSKSTSPQVSELRFRLSQPRQSDEFHKVPTRLGGIAESLAPDVVDDGREIPQRMASSESAFPLFPYFRCSCRILSNDPVPHHQDSRSTVT